MLVFNLHFQFGIQKEGLDVLIEYVIISLFPFSAMGKRLLSLLVYRNVNILHVIYNIIPTKYQHFIHDSP